MSDTETEKEPIVQGKGRGKDARGRSRVRREVGGAARSGSNRMRHSSGLILTLILILMSFLTPC